MKIQGEMQAALIKQNALLKQNLAQEEAESLQKDATINQLRDLVIQLEALNLMKEERLAQNERSFVQAEGTAQYLNLRSQPSQDSVEQGFSYLQKEKNSRPLRASPNRGHSF